MDDGAPDIVGIGKETGAPAETTITNLFTVTKNDEKDHKNYPALVEAKMIELGDVKPDFRVVCVSKVRRANRLCLTVHCY